MGIKAEEMKALMEKIRQGLKNKFTGSSFDDFLIEEGLDQIVNEKAVKKTQQVVRKRIRIKKQVVK